MHEREQKAEFDLLMASRSWPADRLQALQRSRIEKLIAHARAHAPFYANRFDAYLKPNGDLDWDRWHDIPTVKRSDLIEHRRAMLSRSVPEEHGNIIDVSSSGSTGRPVATAHTSLALKLTRAAVYRAQVDDEIDFGTGLGLWMGKPEEAPSPDGTLGGRWGPWWDDRAARGTTFQLNHDAPAGQVLDYFGRHGVRYASMGGTDIRALAYEARRLGVQLSLDGVMTRGTDPTPVGVKLAEETFGARTFPLYSSKESHRMAHRCPACGKWHVNDEQILIEILDDDNRPVADGASGRIVTTPFWSYAQPLIRYEQGDFASRGISTCTRAHTTIEEIVGRVRHMFLMPDGSRIVPTIPAAAVAALNASIFQLAQVARDRLEFRYVRIAGAAPPEFGPLDTVLARYRHAGMTIEMQERAQIDVPAGRKHLEFVSEIDGYRSSGS